MIGGCWTDLRSDMEVSQTVFQQDQLQRISEKRKWETEMENKRRQLEDDRRALLHLKSKALRERWLLDGSPSAGPDQDDVKRQLEQEEEKTKSLEETINRLQQELVSLETKVVCPTKTHITGASGSLKEVKGHSAVQQDKAPPSGQVVQEVRVHKSPQAGGTTEMKRAMYSVEIKVERDRLTGETRILSTNTTLPVDLSHQGVKVYEDEQKVVHEVNGDDGVHQLSSFEVDELIHKADEASESQLTVAVASLSAAEIQEEIEEDMGHKLPQSEQAQVLVEITGLKAEPHPEPSVAEASAENPVTMVFMGYQSVEDEAETKKVLGLQGTVTAELVLLDDTDAKTSPGGGAAEGAGGRGGGEREAQTSVLPPAASTTSLPTTKTPVALMGRSGGAAEEALGAEKGGAVAIKKEKQPCKCCSIM